MSSRRQFGNVRRRKSGRYQVRYRDQTGRLVSAPETFIRKGDAVSYLATVEADQLRGAYIDHRAGRITVERWAEEWMTAKRGQRAATLARDRAALAHALPLIGSLPLAAVTPAHVRKVVEAMRAAGLASKSMRTYLGTLRALFNAAVESDRLPRSPVRVRSLDLGPTLRTQRPTLTAEQLLRLADEVPERYSALVLVAGVLGLRWSEAIALRVRDIDFLRRTLTVSQTIEEVAGKLRAIEATKTKASRRTMTVPPFLIERLSHVVASHGSEVHPDLLLFTGPKGGLLRRAFLDRTLRPAIRRAGLPEKLTFHGLRHVATSLMVETGEHPKVIQARLGHASPALSMGLYAHVPDDLDRAAASHLEDLFSTRSGPFVARQSS